MGDSARPAGGPEGGAREKISWCPSTVEQGKKGFEVCSFVGSKSEQRIFFFACDSSLSLATRGSYSGDSMND